MTLFQKRFTILLGVVCILSSASLGATRTDPPTDEQISAAVTRYHKGKSGFERNDPRIAAALQDVSIDQLTAVQFELLGIMLDLAPPDLRARFRVRLQELAKIPDADGASAASQLPRMLDLPPEGAPQADAEAFEEGRIDAILAAASHPGLPAAVKAGRATGLYYFLYFYANGPRVRESGAVKRLAELVDESWALSKVGELAAFTQGAIDPQAGLDRASIDRLRAITSSVIQKALTQASMDEQEREGLLEALNAINSVAARGELIGGPAPALQFLWSNLPNAPTSLADLKGRVVVLDFWATWCGPCVASFPHMRDLQANYRGKPVIFLGVTALQGWILDPKAPDPAQRRVTGLAKDDEINRLKDWAQRMDMTWPICVSKQDLFNPDYGIRGIPSIILIDASGIVRHAGLSATDPALESKIDALIAATEGTR